MADVYSADGDKLGEIPLSENQTAQLEAAGKLTVSYHTPQLLHNVLGKQSGAFVLYKSGDRVFTGDAETFKAFADLRAGIAAAQGKT